MNSSLLPDIGMMKNRTTWAQFCAILPLLGLLVLAGCGPENELGRKAISGKVTLDGKPLEQGTISFEPTTEEGTRTGGTIAKGEFHIEAMNGLPPGTYLVRISAAESSGADTPAPTAAPGPRQGPPAKELIPPDWNVRSQHEVEIKDDGENNLTFDITTSG